VVELRTESLNFFYTIYYYVCIIIITINTYTLMKTILYNSFIWIFLSLFFCLWADVVSSQTSYNMTDGGSIEACGGTFYDPGGTGNYPPPPMGLIVGVEGKKDYVFTICNKLAGKPIKVEFTSFNLWYNTMSLSWPPWNSCAITTEDRLIIYNGPNTSSPSLGTYKKTNSPGVVTANSGCITFKLETKNVGNGSPCAANTGASGWTAIIKSDPPNVGNIIGPDTLIELQQYTYTTDGDLVEGTWGSGNMAIAFVNSTGKVTGVNPGTTNISYIITECGSDIAIKKITIIPEPKPLPDCTISGIDTLCQGDSLLLKSSSEGGVWTTSDSTIATVNSSGLVTASKEGQGGTVTITYQNEENCVGIVEHTLRVNKCNTHSIIVGVDDIDEITEVALFPNPTNSEINLEFEIKNIADVTIALIDMAGRILEERTIDAMAGKNYMLIDMQSFTAGVYSVMLYSNGSKLVKRIVKN